MTALSQFYVEGLDDGITAAEDDWAAELGQRSALLGPVATLAEALGRAQRQLRAARALPDTTAHRLSPAQQAEYERGWLDGYTRKLRALLRL